MISQFKRLLRAASLAALLSSTPSCLAASIRLGQNYSSLVLREDFAGGAALSPRQALDCTGIELPVAVCGADAFTEQNWAAFEIDAFLSNFIQTFGDQALFPTVFVTEQTSPDNPFTRFLCTNLDSAECVHAPNPIPGIETTNCAHSVLRDVQNTECIKYLSPEAAFVVQNWINLFQSLQNQFDAVQDARDAIVASNFINDIVDGLSEEQGSILQAVFEFIVSLVVDVLPFGRAFRLGVEIFSKVNTIISLGGGDPALGGGLEVIQTVVANEQIQDQAERLKDQLSRQINEVVRTTQNRLLGVIDVVFANDVGRATTLTQAEAEASVPFQAAQSGFFLRGVPSRADLATQTETVLKNWVVSSTLQGMQWDLLLDPTQLAEAPAAGVFAADVCRANKGIPNVLGQPCGLFRRDGDFNGARMTNPLVLETLVDFGQAADNAQECGGGQVDWAAALDGTDGGAGELPRCLYNFGITTI